MAVSSVYVMPCGKRSMASTALFFFSSRRRHTRLVSDWSSDVCSSDLGGRAPPPVRAWSTSRARGSASPAEIGRASCRERVEIAGVALALKRKVTKAGKENVNHTIGMNLQTRQVCNEMHGATYRYASIL